MAKSAARPIKDYNFTDGYVFMCSSQTEKEVFARGLFGQTKFKRHLVEKIKPTTALFLLNFSEPKKFKGVFIPDGKPAMNIEAGAWGKRFPAQVRFKRIADLESRDLELCTRIFKGMLSKDDVWEIINQLEKPRPLSQAAIKKAKKIPLKRKSPSVKHGSPPVSPIARNFFAQPKGSRQGHDVRRPARFGPKTIQNLIPDAPRYEDVDQSNLYEIQEARTEILVRLEEVSAELEWEKKHAVVNASKLLQDKFDVLQAEYWKLQHLCMGFVLK